MKDWYTVTIDKFRKAGGGGLYDHYHSMSKLLQTNYPEYPSVIHSLTVEVMSGIRACSDII